MKFYKLHGAGNDFIFFAGVKNPGQSKTAFLCDRNVGIGADGVIFLSKSRGRQDFNMSYFNSDGSEAEFCANGARCSVLLASKLGYFKGMSCSFKAGDGIHDAQILKGGKIKLEMKKPEGYVKGLKFKGIRQEFYFLNTGVEHTVGYFDDIGAIDVQSAGKLIRGSFRFSKGTNVNFIQKISSDTLKIRTYERGVEAETKACGTGITAAGYLDMLLSNDFKRRKLITVGGTELEVSLEREKLYLTGPAELVFEGEILL
jgi:diaminopimelate epimerase